MEVRSDILVRTRSLPSCHPWTPSPPPTGLNGRGRQKRRGEITSSDLLSRGRTVSSSPSRKRRPDRARTGPIWRRARGRWQSRPYRARHPSWPPTRRSSTSTSPAPSPRSLPTSKQNQKEVQDQQDRTYNQTAHRPTIIFRVFDGVLPTFHIFGSRLDALFVTTQRTPKRRPKRLFSQQL